MKKIAEFYKVSEAEYLKTGTKEEYEAVILPRRATAGSAGYDFFTPVTFTLAPGEEIKIATGVRVKIDDGWMLGIYPRSGLGFKYRLTLNNTVGIIDGDYFYAENEGHIFIKLTNCGNLPLTVEKGKAFAQGIFTEYGVTYSDEAAGIRTGGFGSTEKQ